jgi:sigma-E factor negative regulatory protein RseB
VAARYWLDRATALPLRRELYGQGARVVAEVAFAQLRLGPAPAGAMPSAAARRWPGRLTAARRAALRAAGWPLPRALAGGLSLFAATQTATPSGRVVELSYSDGLSVVSVFVQRGQLPARMPGWRPVTEDGREVYVTDAGDQSVAWSAGGYVVTVVSDAPAGTAARAVAGLPAARPPGFWSRMGRGFRRLLSWANPLS